MTLRCAAVLLLAATLLTGAAALRSAEYDEQYTLFLTAGAARPVWPATPLRVGAIQRQQAGRASLASIARDLRATDVHPPLYFWVAALWRRIFGPSLFTARLLSVACSLGALAAVAGIAVRAAVPAPMAMLLTLGCYGFAYTGVIARDFAPAQLLTLLGVLVLLHAPGRRWALWLAGMLFGAAMASNYLAVFVAAAALGMGALRCLGASPSIAGLGLEADQGHDAGARGKAGICRVWPARPLPHSRRSRARYPAGPPCPSRTMIWSGFGLAPWLLLDLWFFLAQRAARSGQFPPFHLAEALRRLATYGAANLFGGLPLYAGMAARPFIAALLAAMLLGLTTW